METFEYKGRIYQILEKPGGVGCAKCAGHTTPRLCYEFVSRHKCLSAFRTDNRSVYLVPLTYELTEGL